MKSFGSLLDRVRVAAPCSADWKEMRGDERVRFCDRCSLNVYNLSAMTRREAERLVVGSEGRLCVRFYRRADGTTLTQNCPVGLRKLKRRVSRVAGATAAATISFFTGVGLAPEAKKLETSAPPVVTQLQTLPAADSSHVPPAWEAEEMWVAGGATVDPVGGLIIPTGLLGSLIALCSYPLLKIRDWRAARRRDELRIWRNP